MERPEQAEKADVVWTIKELWGADLEGVCHELRSMVVAFSSANMGILMDFPGF